MKLEGHVSIPTTPPRAYMLLTDPTVLVHTMPGLKSLTPLSDHVYKAEMEIAAIKGKYRGELHMEDMIDDKAYQLRMEGDGPAISRVCKCRRGYGKCRTASALGCC